MKKHFYFYIGTTAELIKVAPIIRQFEKRDIKFKFVSSNQNILHFEQLKGFIKKDKQDYTIKTKNLYNKLPALPRFMLWAITTFCASSVYFKKEFQRKNKKTMFLIVHGDTVSSLIGALVAKLNGVNVVHVESGLRSFNFFEPFPEELCRFIISRVSDIHFCPNEWALNNLKNVKGVKINTFNNTVSESISFALKQNRKPNIGLKGREKYYILVVHRQEHTLFNKEKTKRMIDNVLKYSGDDLKCVFIMHDLTKEYLISQGMFNKLKKNKNIILPPRLPYVEFINLMKGAEFIATDGGGNQEDSYYLGLPCLILRRRTERVEGLGENAVLSKMEMSKMLAFFNTYSKNRRENGKLFYIKASSVIANYFASTDKKSL